jgi:hypothetical protein
LLLSANPQALPEEWRQSWWRCGCRRPQSSTLRSAKHESLPGTDWDRIVYPTHGNHLTVVHQENCHGQPGKCDFVRLRHVAVFNGAILLCHKMIQDLLARDRLSKTRLVGRLCPWAQTHPNDHGV